MVKLIRKIPWIREKSNSPSVNQRSPYDIFLASLKRWDCPKSASATLTEFLKLLITTKRFLNNPCADEILAFMDFHEGLIESRCLLSC